MFQFNVRELNMLRDTWQVEQAVKGDDFNAECSKMYTTFHCGGQCVTGQEPVCKRGILKYM